MTADQDTIDDAPLIEALTAGLPPLEAWPGAWLNLEREHLQTRQAWVALLEEPALRERLMKLSTSAFHQLVVLLIQLRSATLLSFSEAPELTRLLEELRFEFQLSFKQWEAQPQLASEWLRARLIERLRETREPQLPTEELVSRASLWDEADELTGPVDWSDAEPPPELDFDLDTTGAPPPVEPPSSVPISRGAPFARPRVPSTQSEGVPPPDAHPLPPPPLIPGPAPQAPSQLAGSGAPPPEPSPDRPAPAPTPSAAPRDELGIDRSAELQVTEELKPQAKEAHDLSPAPPSVSPDLDPAPLRRPPSLLERWLGEDAGRPGPLERLTERLSGLSRALYHLLGLYSLLLLYFIDQLWELISGYIKGAFQGLMNLRSALRVSALRAEGRLAEGFAEDAARALTLSRALLCLPPRPRPSALSGEEAQPRQLLALALSARAAADDLRRDLGTLQPGGLKRGFFRALGGWLIDLIPNPLSLLKPWVGWLLLGFKLRSPRAELIELDRQLHRDLKRLEELLRSSSTGAQTTALGPLSRSLQSSLDRLLVISLQSYRHAHPERWGELDAIAELALSSPGHSLHPLSASVARARLLELMISTHELDPARERALLLRLAEAKSLTLQLKQLHERAFL